MTNMRRPEFVFKVRIMKASRYRTLRPTQMHSIAYLLRLFLAVQANPKHVLANFDVSNAFLNAEAFRRCRHTDTTSARVVAVRSRETWHSLSVHKGALWFERGTQVMGRSQRQDLDFLCLPD